MTDAELALLEFLWRAGEVTIRAMAEALYPPGTNREQATVQKLLRRLEDKGYVIRDRRKFAHTVRAAMDRANFAGRQLAAMAQRLSQGSLAPLLTQLVENQQLSKRDRDQLRGLLDKYSNEDGR